MEKSTAKWAWGGREDGCHRQDLKSRNRRLRERADISALETRGQAQFTEFNVLSVAALPVVAAAPPRPSESRAWGEALSEPPGPFVPPPGPVAFGQNLGPGALPQAHYLIPGLGTQAQIPGLGYETRRGTFCRFLVPPWRPKKKSCIEFEQPTHANGLERNLENVGEVWQSGA